MLKIVVRMVLLGMIVLGANAGANEWTDAADARNAWAELLTRPSTDERDAETISLFRLTSEESLQGGIAPPTALAIIACRIDEKPHDGGSAASDWRELEWHMPVECMRVVETLTDAAALNNLWLQQLSPNLSEHSVCAEIGMTYAPLWEAAHKNWAIVKVGCPTKMVDARGNIVGWHMPECQGTIPGTRYPLRCRFDPSEI